MFELQTSALCFWLWLLHVWLCVGFIIRKQPFLCVTPTQTSGFNKQKCYWPGLAWRPSHPPPAQTMVVFSPWPPPVRHSQKHTHTHTACTFGLLLTLKPHSILLSRHGHAAPLHSRTAHFTPKIEDEQCTKELLVCKQAITEASVLPRLFSPLQPHS